MLSGKGNFPVASTYRRTCGRGRGRPLFFFAAPNAMSVFHGARQAATTCNEHTLRKQGSVMFGRLDYQISRYFLHYMECMNGLDTGAHAAASATPAAKRSLFAHGRNSYASGAMYLLPRGTSVRIPSDGLQICNIYIVTMSHKGG